MQHKVTAYVNVVDERAEVPQYGTSLSAGFDLAVIDDVKLWPAESDVYSTGLIIQAPPDHMLLVTPRSSTFKKWGVTLGNTVGIVDEDYCGPEDVLRLYIHNPGSGVASIPAGTRLAQGIFVPITRTAFEVREESLARTRGGWGSTGD